MDHYLKYLKYKNKYLYLKKQLGAATASGATVSSIAAATVSSIAAGVVAPRDTPYSNKLGIYVEKAYDADGNLFTITYRNGKPIMVAKQDVSNGSWSMIDLDTFYTNYEIESSSINTVPIRSGHMLVRRVPVPQAKPLD